MAELLKMYPSGFLGSSTVAQTKPAPAATVASQLLNRGLVRATSPHSANQAVIELWADVIGGSPEYKLFEFKERVLRCALSAFGTDGIVQWIDTQLPNPEFTDNHSRWFDETLLYVFAGQRRALSDNNWRALLSAGGQVNYSSQLSPTVRHFLLGECNKQFPSPCESRARLSVRQMLAHWCQQPAGVSDLMASLNVMFGLRQTS
jgi:hypothetical protein